MGGGGIADPVAGQAVDTALLFACPLFVRLPASPLPGPNGMSLRPDGPTMRRTLEAFKGTPIIFSFLVGLQLPKGLVLLHEHTDHFSLQARGGPSRFTPPPPCPFRV